MSVWTQVMGTFSIFSKATPRLDKVVGTLPRGSEGPLKAFAQVHGDYVVCVYGGLRDFDEFKTNEIYRWLVDLTKRCLIISGVFVIEVNDKQVVYVYDTRKERWYEQK